MQRGPAPLPGSRARSNGWWGILKRIFEELQKSFKVPKEALRIEWGPIGKKCGEGFHLNYAGKVLTLKAEGYLGAIQALQTAFSGIASGHLKDFLGEGRPRFTMRPLWIEKSLCQGLKDPIKLHLLCKKVLELGYNAVLLDASEDLNAVYGDICGYGLKVILKVPEIGGVLSPFNKAFKEMVVQQVKKIQSFRCDYLLWESCWQSVDYLQDPDSENLTLPEIVIEEARLIENALDDSKKLIFFVPAADLKAAEESSLWMERIADDLRSSSILSFPAVAGNLFANHIQAHPFWEKLRHQLYPSSSALMPILNAGQAKQGEGLWPVLSEDIIENYVPRCRNANFVGILTLTGEIPAEHGILHCNLWAAAQAMWTNLPVKMLIETWFGAFRPDWNYSLNRELLSQIQMLSKEVHFLKSITNENRRDFLSGQECKQMAESILSKLNDLESKFEKNHKFSKKQEKSSLNDYFVFFAIDVRRIVAYVMQCCHISIPHGLNENEDKEAFWTKGNGSGPRSTSRITLLEVPNKSHTSPKMHAIYQENRLLS